MSISINIDKMLELRNKTMYWLAKESGVSYPNLFKLTKNQTTSIKFDILEKICLALECTPNDILEITPPEK